VTAAHPKVGKLGGVTFQNKTKKKTMWPVRVEKQGGGAKPTHRNTETIDSGQDYMAGNSILKAAATCPFSA